MELNLEDNKIEFLINDSYSIVFELEMGLHNIYEKIKTNAYLINNKNKKLIYYSDYLSVAMSIFIDSLISSISGQDPIKPELFELGVGYYENLRNFHGAKLEYLDSKFFQDYPDPSQFNNDLYFLLSPLKYSNYQSWLYHHDGHIFLEVAEIFNWTECDDADYRNFEVFMQNYSFKRFEITRETAQQWISIGKTIMEAIHAAGKAGKLWGPEPDMPL